MNTLNPQDIFNQIVQINNHQKRRYRMATTVIDALRNAQINLETVGNMGAKNNPIFGIAMEQISNVIAALENDKGPYDEIDIVAGKLSGE